MPEGPSIVILKEEAAIFRNKKILAATGNSSKIPLAQLKLKTVRDFRSWGKHFLICFDKFFIRIHFLLFGSYKINEEKNAIPRLSLKFTNGTLNFYACSVVIIEDDPDEIYDWTTDVMNRGWDAKNAAKKMKSKGNLMICDILLDQEIFSGVGNIIKNEVLYRVRVHPETLVKDIPARKRTQIMKEAVNYSFDFLKWKKEFVLKKNWLIHTKKTCKRCDHPVTKKYSGKTKRRTFFCENCQVNYSEQM